MVSKLSAADRAASSLLSHHGIVFDTQDDRNMSAVISDLEQQLHGLDRNLDKYRSRSKVVAWAKDAQFRRRFTLANTIFSELCDRFGQHVNRVLEKNGHVRPTTIDQREGAEEEGEEGSSGRVAHSFVSKVDEKLRFGAREIGVRGHRRSHQHATRSESPQPRVAFFGANEKRLLFRLFELKRRLYSVNADAVANREIASSLRRYVEAMRRVHSSWVSATRRAGGNDDGVPSAERKALDTMERSCVWPAKTMFVSQLNRFAELQAREFVVEREVDLTLEDASLLLLAYETNGVVPVIDQVRDEWEEARDAGAADLMILSPMFAVDYNDLHRMVSDSLDGIYKSAMENMMNVINRMDSGVDPENRREIEHGGERQHVRQVRELYSYVTHDLPKEIRRAVDQGTERDIDGFVDSVSREVAYADPADQASVDRVSDLLSSIKSVVAPKPK